MKLTSSLQDILNDHRTGQDSTQLGSFVLGGRTPWGVYKQAIRELYKRIRGLRQMITDRDLILIDIEELEELSKGDDRAARRAQINLRAKMGSLEEISRGIADTKREAALFYEQAAELKSFLGEISEERRRQLDREEWKWWHLKRVAVQGITELTIENLISLPTAERLEWLKLFHDREAVQAAVERSEYGREAPLFPDAQTITLIERELNYER